MTFLNSILNNSKKYESPFNHWEYNNALSDEAIKEIALKDYQSTAGNLFLYDGLTQNLDKIRLIKNYECPVCSK